MLVLLPVGLVNTKVVMGQTLDITTENLEVGFHVLLMATTAGMGHSTFLCSECLCTRLAVISGVTLGDTP
jgi:hypothetical protein